MWYLLVAAGAGYLAQRWQNTHRLRHLSHGKCQNPSPSPPSSDPATPKSSCFSLSEMNEPKAVLNANASSCGPIEKEGISAPLSCFVGANAEGNILYQQVSNLSTNSPQGNISFPQVLKSTNKRSACEAFLVPGLDAFKSIQGNKNGLVAPSPTLDSINSKDNTQDRFLSISRPSSESADIRQITKGHSVSTDIHGNPKDGLVFVSKSNLDFVNTDKKEQLQGDSNSPSSCCSSSSTVLNSPIGRKPFAQKLESVQFQVKEQRWETNVYGPSSTLQNHVTGCSNFPDDNTFKESGQRVFFSVPKYDCSQENYAEALQHRSQWGNSLVSKPRSNNNAVPSFNAPVFLDNNEVVATGIQRPFVFKGQNQRGITRTEHFSDEFLCNDKVKLEMTRSTVPNLNFPRKGSSPVFPSRSVANENACENDSESLVSFGLAMAVLFMVSSSKKETEKMGKVLKDTEDLVSDMRKELEGRRAQACISSLTFGDDKCIEKPLAIKSKDAVTQIGKTDMHMDSLCQVGCSDDESIRSVITEEHARYGLHVYDFHAGHEAKLQFVETAMEGYLDGGKQNKECDSDDEKDLSTREEAGEDDYVLSLLELERKLWKVFQERQEEKILELEASLEMALSKLQEKEEELEWWKNRAAWLMEHSVGSTSGAISVKHRMEIAQEGLNHTDTSGLMSKGCDNSGEITHQFLACNTNAREFSAHETSFLAEEEECIEFVGNADGLESRSGLQNQLVRVGSDGSISSSEESVLSFDVRTFTYPGYMGSIQAS